MGKKLKWERKKGESCIKKRFGDERNSFVQSGSGSDPLEECGSGPNLYYISIGLPSSTLLQYFIP